MQQSVAAADGGSNNRFLDQADDALITFHSAVLDSKRAMEGVRVGLSVLRRSIASQSVREAAQSMHSALESTQSALQCKQAAASIESIADKMELKLQRAARGAVGRRRTTIHELKEGLSAVKA